MVNDQEPRYRLVDSNGNVVGSLFQNADGNVEIQDETGTGSVFGPDGIVTPAIDAGSVSTEQLNTNPTGTLVGLDGDQTIANDTITDIEWQTETARGEVSGLLDSTNNEVIVPSGFNWAKITVSGFWSGTIEIDVFETRVNGDTFEGMGDTRVTTARGVTAVSAFTPVSENDAITAITRHDAGQSEDLFDNDRTWMEVVLI